MTAIDLNFDLTPDQVRLREETQRFAAEVLRPAALELDQLTPEEVIAPGSTLRRVFAQTYRTGYHLRAFPPELGGAGLGPMDGWVVGEAMGWGSSGLSISLGVTSMPFRFAAMTGNPDLMRDVVQPYLDDTEGKYIGCWCATEPHHGSDAILFSGADSRPDIHFESKGLSDGVCGLARAPQIARIHGPDRVLRTLLAQETQFPPPRTRQRNVLVTLKPRITLCGCVSDQYQPTSCCGQVSIAPLFSFPSSHKKSVLLKEVAEASLRFLIPDAAQIPIHIRRKDKPRE